MSLDTQEKAKVEYQQLKESVTWYRSLWYKTLDSWSQFRRVVAKVVYGLPTPLRRYLPPSTAGSSQSALHSALLSPGRDGEPLQEQQLELFSARTSTHTFQGNQLRLWFSSIAYVLMNALQNCLATTELASAQVEPSAPSYSNSAHGYYQCSAHSDCYQHWLSLPNSLCYCLY